MATIKLSGGDMGREQIMVRCNLTDASSPVEVDYCEGDGWQATQYQCAETRHRTSGLIAIGKELAARAVGADPGFDCQAEEVEVDANVVYVVRDASGEYISGKYAGERTPAADEAKVFDSRDDAEAACERSTDRVLSRDVE